MLAWPGGDFESRQLGLTAAPGIATTLPQFFYFDAIVLFGFVVFAARHIPDSMLILACVIPVFLAAIIGLII